VAADAGTELVGLLGSLLAPEDEEEIWQILEALPDPAGTFYRFGLADSALQRALDWAPPSDSDPEETKP
jgi:hypothetical protein